MKFAFRLLGSVVLLASFGTAEIRAAESRVRVAFTEHGVPHVRADDFFGVGYGYGYAAASIDLCALAEVFLDVRGERALYLGASFSDDNALLGRPAENVVKDFAVHLLADDKAVAAQRAGLSREARDVVQGYANGFNRYLADTPAEKRPRGCRDAKWVRPITSDDVLRRVISAVLVGGMFDSELYDAYPPSGRPTAFHDEGNTVQPSDAGSNAMAFGADRTSHGRGLLLGNPHWFWGSPNRFIQAHLTIPGKYDVSGASILGVPLINIGYNPSMAWTHTVATDYRATVYELTLDPTDPTRYVVDGKSRPMSRRDVAIEVRNADGSLGRTTHTFWMSEYGPLVASEKLPWTTKTAYALADGDADDSRYLRQLVEMGTSKDVRQLKRALANTLGLVWVNTIAADSQGEALYADYNVIPNVPRAVFESCTKKMTFPQATLANVMDGSRSSCRWRVNAHGNDRNAMPSGDKPALITRDYVENSNSSHWLVNAKLPLEGFSPMIGRERTPPNLRTRFGHRLAAEFARTGKDERDDMQRLESMLFSNRDYLAELILDDLLEACTKSTQSHEPSRSGASLKASCDVLSAWDRKDNLDSRGAALFREFARQVKPAGEEDPAASTDFWSIPFDPAKPLETPRGLNTASSRPLEALARAAERLAKAEIPLNKPLGEIQFIERNGKRIPLHGGLIFNRISLTLKPGVGYTEPIGSADSYLQVVTFDDKGPIADTLLVNSQSSDPDSPWYADQAELYAGKEWVRMPFSQEDIERHAVGVPVELSYRRE